MTNLVCLFVSANVVGPWIRVDLGKEYDVAYLQIVSVETISPLDDVNGMYVYKTYIDALQTNTP